MHAGHVPSRLRELSQNPTKLSATIDSLARFVPRFIVSSLDLRTPNIDPFADVTTVTVASITAAAAAAAATAAAAAAAAGPTSPDRLSYRSDAPASPKAAGDGRAARDMLAVVLFADVSGFTNMTATLARKGAIGTEEMTQVTACLPACMHAGHVTSARG